MDDDLGSLGGVGVLGQRVLMGGGGQGSRVAAGGARPAGLAGGAAAGFLARACAAAAYARNSGCEGEHTSVNFQGFMEGALRSGYRCASEIAGP
jgi:hypothetical protein